MGSCEPRILNCQKTSATALSRTSPAGYGERLRRFLSQRLRNVSDAPDLAQEVFLRLMRVEHHETIRSPEAYLFTVASHVLHQHTLRQSITPVSVDISELFSELQLTSTCLLYTSPS